MKQKNTTMIISKDVMKQLKQIALDRDTNCKAIVEELITDYKNAKDRDNDKDKKDP